tara:strand:- start:354 stop:740 length:387 start_codon:yes stop_codon:yes gene_type:complete
MKITKSELRRIIKEERTKIVREYRSREAVEGKLIGELAGLLADLQGIKHELPGLVGADGQDMGSVYGEALEATILEIEDWADKLEAHFESMDPPSPGRTAATMDEGTDPEDMPDAWRQILGDRLKDKR